MKQQSLTLAISLALSTVALPAIAEITLYDYIEATSTYEDAYLSASADFSKNRGDEQSAYDLKLEVDYDNVTSAPKRDITFKFKADANVDRKPTAGAKEEEDYTAGASIAIDNYFKENSKAGFWFGKVSVDANSQYDDLDTRLGVGLGYGRVVNVTPMAETIRLVDALKKRGSISKKPSKAVYNQIANIIAKDAKYASKHGRKDYHKFWISDIESALRDSGVLAGNFNAMGVLEARQVLVDELISVRKHGWKVRAGVNYVGSNFNGIKSKLGLELNAEYHLPFSNRTQFSNEAVLTTVLNSNEADAFKLKNNMTLTHEVDDRIDWENAWTLEYDKVKGDKDITINVLSSSFLYKLTNSLDYIVSLSLTDVDGTTYEDGVDKSLNMGIRYRLK